MIRSTISKLKDYRQKSKVFAGILDRKLYTGPLTVQIDFTNQCNNSCVGCWCHSPMLQELAMDPDTKKQFIPIDILKNLIDDLDDLGVRDIYIAGGGEPFMHPQAVEAIEYIKKKGMRCDMSNNFTILNKNMIERLILAGIDNMNCSIWAGSPEGYERTHPNKKKEDFNKIYERFVLFDRMKKKFGKKKPTLYIYNVISTLNYDDFENMVEFAFKAKVTGIDFTPTDIVPGKTDALMLSKKQRDKLAKNIEAIWDKMKIWEKKYNHKIDFRNHEQFLRRVKSEESEKGVYDKNIIGTMPCYAGWTYLRILANGDVNPCLKAVKMPVGNIFKESIKDIWKGKKQEEFRMHTIDYKVEDPYFRNIGNMFQSGNGCLLCCDNLGQNLWVHGQLNGMKTSDKLGMRIMKRL